MLLRRERTIAMLFLLFIMVGCAGTVRGQPATPTLPAFPTGHPLPTPGPVSIGRAYEDFGITITPLRYQQQVDPQQVCYSYLCQKPDLHYSGLDYTVQNATDRDLEIVLCYQGLNPGVAESGPPEVIDGRDYHLDPTFPRMLIQVPHRSKQQHAADYLQEFPSDTTLGITICASPYNSDAIVYQSPILFTLTFTT